MRFSELDELNTSPIYLSALDFLTRQNSWERFILYHSLLSLHIPVSSRYRKANSSTSFSISLRIIIQTWSQGKYKMLKSKVCQSHLWFDCYIPYYSQFSTKFYYRLCWRQIWKKIPEWMIQHLVLHLQTAVSLVFQKSTKWQTIYINMPKICFT